MKAGALPKQSGLMRAGVPALQQRLSFSFVHIEQSHEKFHYAQRDPGYFCKVIERLSAMSSMTAQEVHSSKSPALRAHPIEWGSTSEPDGFSNLNEQLRSSRPYQLSISSNAHGRIHGFFIDHIFFVVWLDPDHSLYPGK